MRFFRRKRQDRVEAAAPSPRGPRPLDLEIQPDDPVVDYFLRNSGAIDVASLPLVSRAAADLQSAGVRLVVPLVSSGELIGLMSLGPRRSQGEYSVDDKKLLNDLASHAAPAVRVAQLVKQQENEIRQRERMEQELNLAQLIQQQFLPKELPDLPGWEVSALYRPARAVGGDFYDFMELPGGKLGIVVGDVTDKGVPAALVMATTHSMLRSDGPRLISPAAVLEHANEVLVGEIPTQMFVTCLYAVLDPETGRLVFANAGHNLPFVRTSDGVTEFRATGMPLGLMKGMSYDEKEAYLAPGDIMLLHSDGLAEAHRGDRELFGFERVRQVMHDPAAPSLLIDRLMNALDEHTGANWEQEDDITLVGIQRKADVPARVRTDGGPPKVIADFAVPSKPGNEREAIAKVVAALSSFEVPTGKLDRLKTAVGEATMNAIEHGNRNDPDIPVLIKVLANDEELSVHITDRGHSPHILDAEEPDLEAKLAGLQKPRGWGLFLIKNMVDELNVDSDGTHHTVKLVLHLEPADG